MSDLSRPLGKAFYIKCFQFVGKCEVVEKKNCFGKTYLQQMQSYLGKKAFPQDIKKQVLEVSTTGFLS